MVVALVVVALAFGLGSIPFGVIVAKRRGVDIRAEGSGNIGATNVTRVLGVGAGAIVLSCDAAKGALAVAIAMRSPSDWVVAAAGFAVVLGHCFSPWLGGRGGKGVATALGVFVVIEPALAAAAVLVFAGALLATRVPAVGSLSGAVVLAVLCIRGGNAPLAVLACALLALLIYTHRANLAKLR